MFLVVVFLGWINIGVFDRSETLPDGAPRHQADGTALVVKLISERREKLQGEMFQEEDEPELGIFSGI
jgi:hypothetical protein